MPENMRAPTEPSLIEFAWLERLINQLKSRERLVLGIAVGFQIAVLLTMIALRATPLLTGSTILVRVVPVDPRDFFRGDYVMLSYEFSRIPSQGIEGLPQEPAQRNTREWLGRDVYVSLVPETDGRHWRTEKISLRPPASGVYLRGVIADFGRLSFGIEAYYVQEGTGREYEEAILNRRLSAELAVTEDGQAALRGLHIDESTP